MKVSWQLHLPVPGLLTGGPLEGQYGLVQAHAHWGAGPGTGSEHTLDGRAFEAELHIVHYNTKAAVAQSCAYQAVTLQSL